MGLSSQDLQEVIKRGCGVDIGEVVLDDFLECWSVVGTF